MKTTKKEHTATILQNIFIAILVVIIIGGVFGTIKLTNETPKEDIKYLILQPDCKLYTKWNDKASLVF